MRCNILNVRCGVVFFLAVTTIKTIESALLSRFLYVVVTLTVELYSALKWRSQILHAFPSQDGSKKCSQQWVVFRLTGLCQLVSIQQATGISPVLRATGQALASDGRVPLALSSGSVCFCCVLDRFDENKCCRLVQLEVIEVTLNVLKAECDS